MSADSWMPSKNKRLMRMGGSIAFMLVGCSMVFGLVLLMNSEKSDTRKNEKSASTVVVENTKNKPPKKKEKVKPQKKVLRDARAKSVPKPALASSLSGANFGLSSFSGLDVKEATESALADQAANDAVMTANTVDEPPKPISQSPPVYPQRARSKNIEGYVKLNLLVDESGVVEKVKVLEAEPSGVFDEETVLAAKTWRFQPAIYKGQARRVWITIRIPFKLS